MGTGRGCGLDRAGNGRQTPAPRREKPLLSAEKRRQKKIRLDEQLAFTALTKLRGTALKVVQMLSIETSLLSDSFRKELSKSYHQMSPIGRVLVRKLMREEFECPAYEVFAKFDHNDLTAASLGQVHAAKDDPGNRMAVNLQYPGIGTSIANDLKLARSLVKRTKQAHIYLSSLAEIKTRLLEEVDYQQEADSTQWFRSQLKLEGVTIPRVYSGLSSTRVVTTERLPGNHFKK